jgi:hypothetical protein
VTTTAFAAATATASSTTMRVAVTQLFRRGVARADDLHIKRQLHARERMIPVEQHLVALDRHHQSIAILEKIGAKYDLTEAHYPLALIYPVIIHTENCEISKIKMLILGYNGSVFIINKQQK